MDPKKRNFITQLVSWAFAAPLALLAIRAAVAQSTGPKLPTGIPPGYGGNNDPSGGVAKPDPKQMLKQNQDQIHDDVEKLYTLASDPKPQVEKTASANLLSLSMGGKAEPVKKIPRQKKNV